MKRGNGGTGHRFCTKRGLTRLLLHAGITAVWQCVILVWWQQRDTYVVYQKHTTHLLLPGGVCTGLVPCTCAALSYSTYHVMTIPGSLRWFKSRHYIRMAAVVSKIRIWLVDDEALSVWFAD